MAGLDLEQPPVILARQLLDLIAELTGNRDPFAADKVRANQRVMELLPGLAEVVDQAADPLLAALEASIVGNYIDAGVRERFDWEAELGGAGQSLEPAVVDAFRARLGRGVRVLILGDNAGEIGMDRLLVQQLARLGCRVTYAVRSGPVLNDATLEDARAVGMDRLCEVVTSGCDLPGTLPEHCAPQFLERMRKAEVVISKGQGNYESLEGCWPDVYFAFKAKCERVAGILGVGKGASLFIRQDQ